MAIVMTGSTMMGVGRVAIVTGFAVVLVMTVGFTEEPLVREPDKRDSISPVEYGELNSQKDVGLTFVTLRLNTSTAINTVDERFVSVGATMGSLNRTLGQHFNSSRFWTLARGLAPAIYRLGGAEADFTYFDEFSTPDECYSKNVYRRERHKENLGKLHFNNMTLCAQVWNNINEFARSVGWDILFCLNALDRNETSWDPTNSLQLINYTKQRGYPVLWGLGNEPNGFPRKANVSVNGTQMAEAFLQLRKSVLQLPDHGNMFLVGPDTSAPSKIRPDSTLTSTDTYLNAFLQRVGNATNVTSFHFYYTSGRTAGFQNITDPSVADNLIQNIKSVAKSVSEYGSYENSKIWITESGLTFGGSPSGLSGNYITGMLILDKLGMSASLGVNLIVQQGLIGKDGGLFDAAHKPRLPYWLLLYHKRLMGTRVLDVSKLVSTKASKGYGFFDFTRFVRTYAHCTKPGIKYNAGAVTLIIVNMIPITSINVQLAEPFHKTTIHEYHFMPIGTQGILSPHGSLNGHRLKMDSDLTLPDYPPRELPAGSTISLPQHTYGFYVLPNVDAPACR